MRIYFDTKFTGLHQKATLISLGCVSESGEEFYAEFTDYDQEQVDEWVRTNVINNLILIQNSAQVTENLHTMKGDTAEIRSEFEVWLSLFDSVELWSDHLAYGWVLFCQIFGHAFNIPKNIYYIPFELSTALKLKGFDPDIDREKFAFGKAYDNMEVQKHTALWDSKVIKRCIERLEV